MAQHDQSGDSTAAAQLPDLTKPVGAAGHLTPGQKHLIRVAYLERGGSETFTDLGKRCVDIIGRAVNREAVSGCLKGQHYESLRAQFDKELKANAIERLKSGILPAADAWNKAVGKAADRGDHKPARDLLMHTGTIEPLDDDGRAQGPLVLVMVKQGDRHVYQGGGQTYTQDERDALALKSKHTIVQLGIAEEDVTFTPATQGDPGNGI